MPIYEYRCESCEQHHEAIQTMSAEPLVECPKCGGKLQKLISNSSFVLKGGGWYADGYADSSSNKTSDSASQKPAGKPDTISVDSGKKTDLAASNNSGSTKKKAELKSA